MNKRKISYLVLSDIHLGHRKTSTQHIVDNLRKYIKTNHTRFKKLDIIFLAGDIFDRLLTPSSDDYTLATRWLSELVLYCKVHRIKLRVLEGTPSHDWKQAKAVFEIIEVLTENIDFRYITVLDIEHMDDLGIDILYVPDEYNDTADKTLEEFQELLKVRGIEKVDIAIMHGQFHYQLPMVTVPSSHTESEYLNLVRYYISIGHIHVSSIYERILAQGSFDRISHGEEGCKGGMVIDIYQTGDMEFRFVKNPHARIYKTYRYNQVNLDEVIEVADTDIGTHKPGDAVRLLLDPSISASAIQKALITRYPGISITVDKIKAKGTAPTELTRDEPIITFSITPENIQELLLEAMSKHNLTPTELSIMDTELTTGITTVL